MAARVVSSVRGIPATEEDAAMAVENAPTKKGKEAAADYRKSTKKEERKVEKQKGSDLRKGADRFEERAESADRGKK